MKTLELFSGTKSFSKVAKNFGMETLTIDNDYETRPDICIDIMDFEIDLLMGYKPDIIWSSPPCEKFSVLQISKNWTYGNPPKPKNSETIKAINVAKKQFKIIKKLNPKYWYVENPRAMFRKIFSEYSFATVSYCQYGFKYMKPTDIFTNNDVWKSKAKLCKNGAPCHEKAPRGSKTGLRSVKDRKLRGSIPPKLIEEILRNG
jgi:site-specific DNA-cytosine methylase